MGLVESKSRYKSDVYRFYEPPNFYGAGAENFLYIAFTSRALKKTVTGSAGENPKLYKSKDRNATEKSKNSANTKNRIHGKRS